MVAAIVAPPPCFGRLPLAADRLSSPQILGRDNAMILSNARALAGAAAAALLLAGAAANAADMTCAKDVPKPYKLDAGWAKIPDGRKLGSTSALGLDAKGHVWAAERCGANTCAGSTLAPVLQFDPTGKVVSTWGAGVFAQPHGITVNMIAPGWIPVERHKDDPQSEKDAYLATIPMGRWGKPEEVGWAATYLASDEASFVTGQTIAVNGGKTVW
jgi:hypothetical protein